MPRTQDHVNQGNMLIWEDQWITESEASEMLDTSYGSAFAILHDDSGYWKVSAKWVPRQLTDPHKQQQTEVATEVLPRYEEDPGLTRQDCHSWRDFDPQSERYSREWKHPGSPWEKIKKEKQRPFCQITISIPSPAIWSCLLQNKDKLLIVQLTQLCLKTNSNLQFTTTKTCCGEPFSCTTTMLTCPYWHSGHRRTHTQPSHNNKCQWKKIYMPQNKYQN